MDRSKNIYRYSVYWIVQYPSLLSVWISVVGFTVFEPGKAPPISAVSFASSLENDSGVGSGSLSTLLLIFACSRFISDSV